MNQCPECEKGELVMREAKQGSYVPGFFFIFAGIVLWFLLPIAGILAVALGIVSIVTQGTVTQIICPMCGYVKSL